MQHHVVYIYIARMIFFHWDRDIDLDLLLGEYTNGEFEIDLPDEEVVTTDRTRVTISAKMKKTENMDKK